MDSNQESKIVLREAQEEDCDVILKLIKELMDDHQIQPERQTRTVEDVKRNMFGNSKVSACILAEDIKEDGSHTTVGYAIYSSMIHTFYGRTMWLADLYVKEEYRGKGVGTSLMKRVAECAATDRCNTMLWMVWRPNDKGQRFYKRLGASNVTANENMLSFALEGMAFKDLAAQDVN